MKYRTQEIELPDDDIYRHDALNRKPIVEFLENFLLKLNGPFVLALDSPWGTGKTTAVRMLKATLTAQQVHCVYFNAWKVDYASDPLVALVSALDEIDPNNSDTASKYKGKMANVRKLTTSVIKHGAIAAAKAATFGALEIDSTIERVAADMAGDLTKDVVDSFQKEKASLEKIRTELGKAINELSNDANAKPLVFFIDELDRCRPSFAIEMLERIKHLFDVEHLVFVLSIDKKQLEAATGAIYGEKIDAPEYLRRFFDMELRLPQPDAIGFTKTQINRFGLTEYFDGRRSTFQQDEVQQLAETIGDLAVIFQLSLRTIERVMARVALVCSQTPFNHHLDPIILSFLVVLRIKHSEIFHGITTGHLSPEAVIAHIKTLPNGTDFAESQCGMAIEAYLIVGDTNEKRSTLKISTLRSLAEQDISAPENYRASEIFRNIRLINRNRCHWKIKSITNKIEMASTISS